MTRKASIRMDKKPGRAAVDPKAQKNRRRSMWRATVSYLVLAVLAALCSHPISLSAQTATADTLGGATTSQLQIMITANGYYRIYKYLNNQWYTQFHGTAPLFAIKIGSTVFASYELSAEDISAVTTGIQQHVTKKYSGSYNSNDFSVTLTIRYNTSSPEYFVKTAVLDMSNITGNPSIIFAYGWDSYVNGSDYAYAYILPDFLGYNNGSARDYYMTTAQVRSLHLVGARNSVGNSNSIGFFAMGRPFDRAYSGTPYHRGYSYSLVNNTPGNGSSSGTTDQYKFRFGPYAGPFSSQVGGDDDVSTGVGYDNIPAGQITTIRTGETFTTSIDGELDYTWNGSKDKSVALGDATVALNLTYKGYNLSQMSGIAFQVNLPVAFRAAASHTGFTSAIHDWTAGSPCYTLSSATIPAQGNATITVPVTAGTTGKWTVGADSVTNTVHTIPMGEPANLTVNATVELSDNTATTVCANTEKTFTVKYPGTATNGKAVTVNLNYTGDTGDFSPLPPTVTIPAGENSESFKVKAAASPTGSGNMTITLNGTDDSYVTIGANASVNISANALTPGSIGADQSICRNTAPATFTQTVAASGGTSYIYKWQYREDNNDWTDIGSSNSTDYTYTANLTTNTYFRRAVTDGDCGTTVYTPPVLVTINPLVTVKDIADLPPYHLFAPQYPVYTSIPATVFSSDDNNVFYTWENDNPAIGLAADGQGDQPPFTAAGIGTANITVTPHYGSVSGCAGPSKTYRISVYYMAPVNPHLRSKVVGQ
ncbi:MAG: hypothetical protein LBP25_05130 [Tannerellaceae bacterium]|jgi:hypothetical protein|nr:hypothetical protein [Tannerellaceae bacterium]